ncbi:hypothetical protein NP493_728g01077 [Ridgeia piscesae]|uniref:Uncharacterized protein n=1 Tax=Ridgeia piscesae TaxID=27915 RepID=A0AAD9KQ52_RIDPI|nr:hypothetical protein NP493_728g01077 [Ridgeia piscesae]
MMQTDSPIYVNNTQIENIESYIYLGQRYSTRDKNQDTEIQRRITAGWTAFAKLRDIFKGNNGTCFKRQKSTAHACFQQLHMARKHGHSPHMQRTS